MVQSAPSMRSQMRRAVARLRPWNDTRSIRWSISSVVNPGSAEKGCTGTRRKRDLSGMTAVFYRFLYESERAADPTEDGDAAIDSRHVTPGGAGRKGQRQHESHDGVER
jgi:hypothetical protein